MIDGSKCDDNDNYIGRTIKVSSPTNDKTYTAIIDKSIAIKSDLTDAVQKQNKVNTQHEQRMKAITRIASSAKDSTIRIEKKVHRYNECRMNDIKDIRNDLYRKNDYILQKIQRTKDRVFALEQEMEDVDFKMKKREEKQYKINKVIIGCIFGMILYMIAMTILFCNSQHTIKTYKSPKSMDVIMYDRDNKKEIHYSAYVKIDKEAGTVELQETRKTGEIDLSKKVE